MLRTFQSCYSEVFLFLKILKSIHIYTHTSYPRWDTQGRSLTVLASGNAVRYSGERNGRDMLITCLRFWNLYHVNVLFMQR